MGQLSVNNVFFEILAETVWGAQTTEVSPFRAYCKPFGRLKTHKML